MRWLSLVLVLLMIVPRPVLGFEGSTAPHPCACSCCPGNPDCGCEAAVLPCPQILADLPAGSVLQERVLSAESFVFAALLYSREHLKDIFRPPPAAA